MQVVARRTVAQCPTRDGRVVIHWWTVSLDPRATPRLVGDEHTELRWVSVSELDGLFPRFEEDFDILRDHAIRVAERERRHERP